MCKDLLIKMYVLIPYELSLTDKTNIVKKDDFKYLGLNRKTSNNL